MRRVVFVVLAGILVLGATSAQAGEPANRLLSSLLDRLVAPLGLPPGPPAPELEEIEQATRIPFFRGPESPTHSFSYKFDPSVGALVPSTEGFGSVFGLRPDTLGQGHFTFGLDYVRADFQALDGVDLDKIYISLGSGLVARVSADVLAEALTLRGTYGILDDLDVDLTIPIIHQSFVFRGSMDTPVGLVTAHKSRDAVGIGDILVGAKYRFYNQPFLALAARLELSLPSGDEDDFLGLGTVQVNPSIIASTKLPFGLALHTNVGFRLSGDTDKVEHQFFYVAGLEWSVIRELTLSVDFLGTRIIDNKRPAFRKTMGVGEAPLEPASDNIFDLGIGFKVNVWRNVLATGGVLIPLNTTGIRATVIPSIGVEVTF